MTSLAQGRILVKPLYKPRPHKLRGNIRPRFSLWALFAAVLLFAVVAATVAQHRADAQRRRDRLAQEEARAVDVRQREIDFLDRSRGN